MAPFGRSANGHFPMRRGGGGFMFARRAFSNALTNALKGNPNLPLEEVLLHTDLSSTLRNEADELLTYLAAPDPQRPEFKRVQTVIKWALTLENNDRMPPDFDARFRLFQVNRNAATVLAYPSKRLYDELLLADDFFMNEILAFPHSELAANDDDQDTLHPIFAGHWERVIEMFLRRCDVTRLEGRASDLLDVFNFVIAHPEILAYQYLISRLIVDFRHILEIIWKERPEHHFITEVLNEACRQVLALRQSLKQPGRERDHLAHRLVETRIAGTAGFGDWWERRQNHRPMTWDYKVFPNPTFVLTPRLPGGPSGAEPLALQKYKTCQVIVEQLYGRREGPLEQKWLDFFNLPRLPKKQHSPRIRMNIAYLLLNALQTAYLESASVLEFLQDREVAERVLVCSVFCDPISMVSSQAFRLVRLILYPDLFASTEEQSVSLFRTFSAPGLNISQIVNLPAPRPDFGDLVEKFAEEFVFCEPPLPQMIAAIPIFWNHRYPVLPNIKPNASAEVVPPLRLAMEGGGEYPVHLTGRTPLELCNHYLLDDPAWSDALNFRIMQILISEDRRTKDFRQGGRPANMTQQEFRQKIREDDTLFLRFLTKKFKTRQPLPLQIAYGMDKGQVQTDADTHLVEKAKDQEVHADMGFLPQVLPALPDDPTLTKLPTRFRVPLNGYIYKFARLWSKCLWFQEPDEAGELNFYEMIDKAPELSGTSLRQGKSAQMALQARSVLERTLKADGNRELEDTSEPAVVFRATTSPECNLPPPDGWVDWARERS